MHPYEVATTLRQRHKDESIRLNFGSLYGVVESLERRGLIKAKETRRSGRLTERISIPVRDYPSFQAALSFLPALPPGDVVALLTERAERLESELVQAAAAREFVQKYRIPRLFWVEHEFGTVLREAELGYVRQLIADIESGALDGTAWWHEMHTRSDDDPMPPLPFGGTDIEEGTR